MAWPAGISNPLQIFDNYLVGITTDLNTVVLFGVFACAVILGITVLRRMLLSVGDQPHLSSLQHDEADDIKNRLKSSLRRSHHDD